MFAGLVVFAALATLIWFLMPPTPEPQPLNGGIPNPFADPKAGKAHIEALARRVGDDFDRLSNDEKLFLNSIAMGHGRDLLAKTARELKAKPPPSGPGAGPQP